MPKIYGIEHILYLLFFAILFTVTLIYISKIKDEKKIIKIVRCVGIILLVAILSNRIAIASYENNWMKLIPDTFCGTSSLMFALLVIFGKKDNIGLHCVSYIGVLGGLLTVFYPDFIGQAESIFHLRTITGLVHHTIMVYLFVLIIITGYFKPTYKKWYAIILGGSLYVTYGLFLINALGFTNAMYINSPILEGTGLYWYVLGPLFILIYGIFQIIWELVKKNKNRQ